MVKMAELEFPLTLYHILCTIPKFHIFPHLCSQPLPVKGLSANFIKKYAIFELQAEGNGHPF
jgi:hypothetical protein